MAVKVERSKAALCYGAGHDLADSDVSNRCGTVPITAGDANLALAVEYVTT